MSVRQHRTLPSSLAEKSGAAPGGSIAAVGDCTSAGLWPYLCCLPANTLIVGSTEYRQMALAMALGSRPAHLHYRKAGFPLRLTPVTTGTLVLEGVEDLSTGQQKAMLRWLSHTSLAVRVIALASAPIYPLVEQRRFSGELYYRLCVLQSAQL